jgi:hypothetical protein
VKAAIFGGYIFVSSPIGQTLLQSRRGQALPERASFLRGILLRLVAIYLSVYVIFLSNRERKISAGVSGRLEWGSGVCSSVDV